MDECKRPWSDFDGRGPIGTRELRLLTLWAATMLVLGLSGCSGFARHWQRDQIISARQIALRGMDAVQSENWVEAERLFAQAVEVCPVDESVRSRYAEALWRRQATDEAVEQMREAVRLSGGDFELIVRLGEMYRSLGQMDRAGEMATQAIEAGHETARAFRLRGDTYRQRGMWQEALAAYHRALIVQPHFLEVELSVAQTYCLQNRPQRALSTLQALATRYPSGQHPVELAYWEGVALMNLQRYGQAAEKLSVAVAGRAESPDLLYRLAESRLRTGDLSAAQRTLAQARQTHPNHPAAIRLSAEVEQAIRIARQGVDRPVSR